jgi:ubiquinone biosynthesis protein UbiJ
MNVAAIAVGSIERCLDAALAESTAARDLLESIQGSSLGVRVLGPDLDFVVRAEPAGLRFRQAAMETAAAGLAGTPLALLGLLRARTPRNLAESGVTPHGDAEILEKFSVLFRLLRPDAEEQLARLTGGVAAHELVYGAGKLASWFEKAGTALLDNTAEFLQEERRDLPARAEAEGFYSDVEKLRDDAERAVLRAARFGLDLS